jgi:uncharacterized protein YerC
MMDSGARGNKDQVKQLAEAGQTGKQIKSATGLSLPTIQLIKKAFGLVKSRTAA